MIGDIKPGDESIGNFNEAGGLGYEQEKSVREAVAKKKKAPKREVAFDDSVRYILSEIGKIALLTPQEEVELSTTVREDPDPQKVKAAKERLIRSNLRLVVSIAKNISTEAWISSTFSRKEPSGL